MEPSQIQAGKCYFVITDRARRARQVRRVLQLTPDGRVLFEQRGDNGRKTYWRPGGMLALRVFATMVEREVACDWSLDAEVSFQPG